MGKSGRKFRESQQRRDEKRNRKRAFLIQQDQRPDHRQDRRIAG